MPQPCEQSETIHKIEKEQQNARAESSQILVNQELLAKQQNDLVQKLDNFFQRLEKLLVTDMERRKDIAQLSKDYDILYASLRAQLERIESLEHSKIRQEGYAEKVEEAHAFYEQEKGWRRLITPALAFASCIVAVIAIFL